MKPRPWFRKPRSTNDRLWLVFVFILAVCSLYTNCASAQDSKTVVVDGVRGRWFTMPVAGQLLQDHLQVPELRALVAAGDTLRVELEKRIAIKDEEIANCRNTAVLDATAIRELTESLDAAAISQRAAEDEVIIQQAKHDAWFRHPAIWFGVGFVVAGITTAYLLP